MGLRFANAGRKLKNFDGENEGQKGERELILASVTAEIFSHGHSRDEEFQNASFETHGVSPVPLMGRGCPVWYGPSVRVGRRQLSKSPNPVSLNTPILCQWSSAIHWVSWHRKVSHSCPPKAR
jgi:hypothetical protein